MGDRNKRPSKARGLKKLVGIKDFEKSDKSEFYAHLMHEINLKWTRPLNKCSVGADLPRLGNKHEIRNEKGELIFPPPEGLSDSNHFPTIKLLFHSLARLLKVESDVTATFDQHYKQFYDPTARVDLATNSNEYVKLLGEDHIITKLLKASCSQGIVSPAWVKLKLELLEGFPFKDVKLGWKVFVLVSPSYITVIHQKKEQGEPPQDSVDPAFTFTWELKMVFDRAMTALQFSTFNIIKYDLSTLIHEEKGKLKNIIRDWHEESGVPPQGTPNMDPVLEDDKKKGKPKATTAPPVQAGGLSATDLALQKLFQTAWNNNDDDCLPDWLKFDFLPDEGPLINFAAGSGMDALILDPKRQSGEVKTGLSPSSSETMLTKPRASSANPINRIDEKEEGTPITPGQAKGEGEASSVEIKILEVQSTLEGKSDQEKSEKSEKTDTSVESKANTTTKTTLTTTTTTSSTATAVLGDSTSDTLTTSTTSMEAISSPKLEQKLNSGTATPTSSPIPTTKAQSMLSNSSKKEETDSPKKKRGSRRALTRSLSQPHLQKAKIAASSTASFFNLKQNSPGRQRATTIENETLPTDIPKSSNSAIGESGEVPASAKRKSMKRVSRPERHSAELSKPQEDLSRKDKKDKRDKEKKKEKGDTLSGSRSHSNSNSSGSLPLNDTIIASYLKFKEKKEREAKPKDKPKREKARRADSGKKEKSSQSEGTHSPLPQVPDSPSPKQASFAIDLSEMKNQHGSVAHHRDRSTSCPATPQVNSPLRKVMDRPAEITSPGWFSRRFSKDRQQNSSLAEDPEEETKH